MPCIDFLTIDVQQCNGLGQLHMEETERGDVRGDVCETFAPEIPPSQRAALKNLRSLAVKKGFARIAPDVLGTSAGKKDLADFLRLINEMPADVADKRNTRCRYVTFAHLYKPHDDAETLLYFTEPQYDEDVGAKLFIYQLSKEFNPENSEPRKFAPVPDEALKHRFLRQLIEAGFHVVPLRTDYRSLPLEVEVQFIRYEPRRGVESLGTPPTTHQDNDWAFCVFLLEWRGVDGALNAFVPLEYTNKALRDVPEGETVQMTLTDPLEGYCVEDTKVAHYVGPVRLKQGAEYGRRTIVILSYKPLVPLRPADVRQTAELLRNRPELLEARPDAPEEIKVDQPVVLRAGGQTSTEVRPQAARARKPQKITLRRSIY